MSTKTTRMSVEDRKTSFLVAGVTVAARTSYQNLDLTLVAEHAGGSRPRILQLFDGTVGFREAVLQFAITGTFAFSDSERRGVVFAPDSSPWESDRLAVIAQGIAARHPLCADLDETTKAAALATLAA
ncbi:TetR/AcrR family transcriptional regulator [Stenotrophomonas phage B2]|nr:TetR/AcrR family transcriptional regulator [Stenotrophomonas phage B2]